MAAPSNLEQYLLELVNEARLNPMANATRYITSYSPLVSSDPAIGSALSFFGVNGAALLTAFSALTPTQPLAWNNAIHDAAFGHNAQMIAGDSQSHQLPGEPGLGQRLTNAGYTGWNSAGENIFAFASSVLYAHAGFMVDWGAGPDGMQPGAGHRVSIMSSGFREIGIGITQESNPATSVGPLVVTEDFGRRNAGPPVFILGVAYNDSDGNRFYTPGEGLGTLSISAVGGSTTTAASGGYVLGLSAGATTLTLTGAGLASAVTATGSFVSGSNIKIDVVNGSTLLTSGSISVSGPIARIEGLGLTGLALTAGAGAQTIQGTRGSDTLDGGAGADSLWSWIGGDGVADTLIGGADGDTYFVFEAIDNVVETDANPGTGGTDLVYSYSNRTLSANVEYLTLFGSNASLTSVGGNNLDNALNAMQYVGGSGINFVDDIGNDIVFGSYYADNISTGVGNDTLWGSWGADGRADVMAGGDGADTYYVQEALDTVSETNASTAASEADTVYAGINTTLGANLEYLFIYGSATVATGNSLNNALIGSYSGLQLTFNGLGGNDSITGGAGNDTIDGGAGVDYLTGSGGADTFRFVAGEANGDYIIDFDGAGAGALDSLRFVGYGAGATFTQLNASQWRITYNGGASIETINFFNSASVNAQDVLFV